MDSLNFSNAARFSSVTVGDCSFRLPVAMGMAPELNRRGVRDTVSLRLFCV